MDTEQIKALIEANRLATKVRQEIFALSVFGKVLEMTFDAEYEAALLSLRVA